MAVEAKEHSDSGDYTGEADLLRNLGMTPEEERV